MTDTDPRRVEAILAQVPGPVRLTPSPKKWLLFIVCQAILCAVIGFFILRQGSVSLHTMAGGLVIAILAFSVLGAFGNLVPGVAYLELKADGFEAKTLFGRTRASWKTASNFRPEGTKLNRYIAFDVFTNEPPRSALFNYLIQRQRTLPDNYGMAYDDLARLMNEWRAKVVGASAP